MTGNRWIIIGLIFILSITFFSFYLLFAVNEYAWMHEIDNSVALPDDDNLVFKVYLFGVPTLFMLFVLIYYSFSRFGLLIKSLSVVYSLLVIAAIMSNYPA